MSITFAAMSEWTDAVANLTQLPEIGYRYLSSAPIFRAFGVPQRVPLGVTKVKWTDGATSNIPANTAGMAYTGIVGLVNDSFNIDMGVVAAPAAVDLGTELMGPSFGQQSSMSIAIASIYDKWVYQLLVGTGDGNDYDLWSANEICDNEDTAIGTATMHISGSYSHAEFSADKSLVLDVMEQATSVLPTGDGSYNVCLCGPVWLKNIKREIRKVGGNTASGLAEENYGMGVLMHDGVLYLPTRHLAQVYSEQSKTYVFNVGPSGCSLIVPDTDMFYIQGPKYTEGNLNTSWDLALCSNIIAKSPRSVVELKQIAF